MPIYNTDIAGIFDEIGYLLEIKGENQFRVRAYHSSERIIRHISVSIRGVAAGSKSHMCSIPSRPELLKLLRRRKWLSDSEQKLKNIKGRTLVRPYGYSIEYVLSIR